MHNLYLPVNLVESFAWVEQKAILFVSKRTHSKISLHDVVMMEASGNYTLFHFSDGTKVLLCRTLKAYEVQLDPRWFVRVHKSYLINLHYLKEYNPGYDEKEMLVLRNGFRVNVARRRRREFEERAAPFLRRPWR